MSDQQTQKKLNRLYWESDASVGEIADRLDISRRALYEGIEPLPAGTPCPDCGTELGFRNRTSAENREAECAGCGAEVELDGLPDRGEPEIEQEHRAGALSPTARRVPEAVSAPLLGAALILGMAVGAALAYVLQRDG